MIFQQPNFFGILETGARAGRGGDGRRCAPDRPRRPALARRARGAGNYGCELAIGEGQSAGNYQSYGGPHYGFSPLEDRVHAAAAGPDHRRDDRPAGERGYVLTLQTREQHIRREKATSNITTNQTLLALGGLVYLSWLGPQGLREVGETCMELWRDYAKERLGPSRSPSRAGNVQGVRRPPDAARAT